MALIHDLSSRSEITAAPLLARLGLFAFGVLQRLEALVDRRRLGKLMEFDDRMLADIGVTRGDVASALAGDRLASEALALRACERRHADRARLRDRGQHQEP